MNSQHYQTKESDGLQIPFGQSFGIAKSETRNLGGPDFQISLGDHLNKVNSIDEADVMVDDD